ncbi:MAG: oligosaccharide flippase family protein [Gemmatimonadetes bacterium]|nr:oligosaccharide flippase family protein [Gemmatimonadota bacterium]
MSSTLGRLARNASFNLVQQVWLAALSLVATPVIYHRLGADEYGLFAVVGVITAQLFVLEFGFGHATTKFVAAAAARGEFETVGKIVSTSAVVFLISGLLGALLIAGASDLLVRSYFQVPGELVAVGRRVLLLGALLFFVGIQSNLLGAVWAGFQRFGILNILRGAAATAQVAGAAAIALTGGDVDDVVLWSLAVALVGAGAHLVLLRRMYPQFAVRPRLDRDAFREMWRFGLLLMLSGILFQLFLSGGQLALGHFVAVGLLPIYSIPFGLYRRLAMVGSSVANALFPLVAEMAALGDRDRLLGVRARGTRVLFLFTVPVVVCGLLLATPFLRLWMGEAFAEGAAPVLQAFIVAFGFGVVAVPVTELARGGGRPALLVVYTAILAAVNVGGTLFLGPRLGVVGAALALTGAQAAGAVFLMVASGAARAVLAGLARPAVLGACLAACAGMVAILEDSLALRAASALVLLSAYGWAAYRVGLEAEERVALGRLLPGGGRVRAGETA